MIKIMFGVVFGIVLAGLSTLTIRLMLVQALLTPFGPTPEEKELRAYQAEVKLDHLKHEQQQVLQRRVVQIQRAEDARKSDQQSQRFKAQYQKPVECYNIQNHEMRVNCANHYIRAKAAFEGN